MPDALLSGVSNPEQLAELSKARMRLKIPQLREALASRFTIDHHGVMVAPLLAHIDTLDAAIENLNRRIELVLAPHAELIELPCTIPGVHVHVAQVLVAECGLDMSAFPTVGHSPMPEPSRSPPTASLAASARATSGGGTRCRTRSCLAPATCPARAREDRRGAVAQRPGGALYRHDRQRGSAELLPPAPSVGRARRQRLGDLGHELRSRETRLVGVVEQLCASRIQKLDGEAVVCQRRVHGGDIGRGVQSHGPPPAARCVGEIVRWSTVTHARPSAMVTAWGLPPTAMVAIPLLLGAVGSKRKSKIAPSASSTRLAVPERRSVARGEGERPWETTERRSMAACSSAWVRQAVLVATTSPSVTSGGLVSSSVKFSWTKLAALSVEASSSSRVSNTLVDNITPFPASTQ